MTTKTQKQDKNKLAEIDENISKLFDIKKRLGKGAYGIVWKAMDKRTNETLAVKKIFDAFRDETDAQRTFREIIFLKAFRNHPNVIKLHNVYKASNNLDIYLIFEYMESDLHNIIKKGSILKDIHKRYVMYQLINAIKYIHSGNVIHRDLKPSNVLIDSKCRCKLADFGLARSVSNRPQREVNDISEPLMEPLLTDYVATRWYRAPEILVASKRYTKGIDMWSLGCILGEMIRGKPIFQGTSTVNQIEKIVTALPEITERDINAVGAGFGSVLLSKQISRERKTSLDELLADSPDDALNLVKSLLVLDPLGRLTAKEALEHSYVEKFRNSTVELELNVDILPPFRDDVRLTVPEYRSKLYEIVQVNVEKSHQRQNHVSGTSKTSMHSIHGSSGSSSTNIVKNRYHRSQQIHADLTANKGQSQSKSKLNISCNINEKSFGNRVNGNERFEMNDGSQKKDNVVGNGRTLRVRSSPMQKRRTGSSSHQAMCIPDASAAAAAKPIVGTTEALQKRAVLQHEDEERPQVVIPRCKVLQNNRNSALEDGIYARAHHVTPCAADGIEKRHSIDCGYVSLTDGIIKHLSPPAGDASVRKTYKQNSKAKLHKSSSSLHQVRNYPSQAGGNDTLFALPERLHYSTTAVANDGDRITTSNMMRTTKSDLIPGNVGIQPASRQAPKGNERICYEKRLKKLEEEIEKYKKEVKNFCKETYRYSKQHEQKPQSSSGITSSTSHQTLPHQHRLPRNASNVVLQHVTKYDEQTARVAHLLPISSSGASTPKKSSYVKLPMPKTRDYEFSYVGGGSGDHIGRNNSNSNLKHYDNFGNIPTTNNNNTAHHQQQQQKQQLYHHHQRANKSTTKLISAAQIP